MTKNVICSRCIMDSSDPLIKFNNSGHCDHCENFDRNIKPNWDTGSNGHNTLMNVAKKIKKDSKKRDFDCIIGLSGGLDSSYTAYIATEVMGLRPLLFHVDAGWNTDQAVGNIEKLVDGLDLDLYTEVINWEEMKDLQLSFLKSGIPDQDLPQDTAFFSALYRFARENRIKYVLTGGNYSTECCREPNEWGAYPGIDKRLILDIHKKFGTVPLDTFPIIDVFIYKVIYFHFLRMKVFKPLNYAPFIKKDAETLLNKKFGWVPFKHKHHESRFTRFYEDYWMPKKFGYEKRRAHYSSLIMTNQLSREEALEKIKTPIMSNEFIENEFKYVANKIGISSDELSKIMQGQNKTYRDYKNKSKLINFGAKMISILGIENRQYR